MGAIDFSQFGAFAIVFILMSGAIIWLLKWVSQRDKKIDDKDLQIAELQEKRLQDAKEYKNQTETSLNNLTTLTQQIRDAIFRNNQGV